MRSDEVRFVMLTVHKTYMNIAVHQNATENTVYHILYALLKHCQFW